MPQADQQCHSANFNGNLLISGYWNRNLLLYSIDTDSFSTIHYDFAAEKRKILINAERLYLIECKNGLIYESEDEYHWNQISNSIISDHTSQVYCSYNKKGIYISTDLDDRYYKFDFHNRAMIKLL